MGTMGQKTRYFIGIDTGVNTGYAVWNAETRMLEDMATVKIHQAMKRVEAIAGCSDKICVRVEDPRQRTWFGTENMSRNEERKRLQGVGSVKRDAGIWEEFLKDLGVEFEMVAPKRNITKLTHEQFVRLTGYTGKTNEHCRDAAMLVFQC